MKRNNMSVKINGVFRVSNGQFAGPMLDEDQFVALFRLYRNMDAPERYFFPDLEPAIRGINEQIREGARAQQKLYQQMQDAQQRKQQASELAGLYEDLFDQWNYASSIEDERRKEQQWDAVIRMARPVLMRLRDAMPAPVPVSEWNDELTAGTEQTGRMYTEVLLFIIFARAAYEPASLGKDPTMRKYCREIKEKVKALLAGNNGGNLLLSAAFHQPKHYQMVGELCGLHNQGEADTRLIEYIRSLDTRRVPDPHSPFSNYHPEIQDAYARTVTTPRYPDRQWRMVCALWQIHHRVSQLEILLKQLEKEGGKVDFGHINDLRSQLEQ
ncbi:hypothetical protein C3369_00705 [Escherichia sp. ESNIH1]|nr:hypothetical protein C3369_00705 [Escherichia sp. ESNIH1]